MPSIIELLFFAFAALTLLSASMVVLAKNAVRAVLFLVLTFVSTSGLWVLIGAEFLAMVLVLVYVGAVMVLFLFVVMMLDMNVSPLKSTFIKQLPLALLIAGLMIAEMIWIISGSQFALPADGGMVTYAPDYNNIKAVGNALFTEYVFPFEVAAMILLVAMIAAVGLAFRGMRNRKGQRISEQVAVRACDRVRLVDMPAEVSAEKREKE